jgi:hypothetical protein
LATPETPSENGAEVPDKRALSPIWTWLKDNQDSIKIVLAVIAGIFAAIQYKATHYGDRVKNSSDSIATFRSGDGYKATLNLESFFLSSDIRNIRNEIIAKKITSQQFRKRVLELMQDNHKEDVTKAIRGLKDVSLCVIQGRCEPTTACMHVAVAIQDLRCNFREYIEDLSALHSVCVMDEINYFVDNFCQPWMATYLGAKTYSDLKDNACFYNQESKKWWGGDYCETPLTYIKQPSLWDQLFQ